MAGCCAERILLEAEHTPSALSVSGPIISHDDGAGKVVEVDVCDLVTKECPGPVLSVECVDGCVEVQFDDGRGNNYDARFSPTYRWSVANIPPATEVITGATPDGSVIAGSEVCAQIEVPCCGGTIRADFDHGLSGRDFSGAATILPQYNIDGGPWQLSIDGGRDEIAAIPGGDAQYGELSFHDVAFIDAPAGLHTVCFRRTYLANPFFPITSGEVALNASTLRLSTLAMRCC